MYVVCNLYKQIDCGARVTTRHTQYWGWKCPTCTWTPAQTQVQPSRMAQPVAINDIHG